MLFIDGILDLTTGTKNQYNFSNIFSKVCNTDVSVAENTSNVTQVICDEPVAELSSNEKQVLSVVPPSIDDLTSLNKDSNNCHNLNISKESNCSNGEYFKIYLYHINFVIVYCL